MARLSAHWQQHGLGGRREAEWLLPTGVQPGSSAHLRFLTLPRALSPLRGERALWEAAHATWDDAATRWLFEPAQVASAPWADVEAALHQHGLAKRRQEARAWYGVARALQGRAEGDVRALVAQAGRTSSALLHYLDKSRATFPGLAGARTARLWLDQLRRVGGLPIEEDAPLCVEPSGAARRAAAALGVALDAAPQPAAEVLALEHWRALPAAERRAIFHTLRDADAPCTG